MPRSPDRPYGRSSISELEAIYRNARADAEILRLLDHELGHRTAAAVQPGSSSLAASLRLVPSPTVPWPLLLPPA